MAPWAEKGSFEETCWMKWNQLRECPRQRNENEQIKGPEVRQTLMSPSTQRRPARPQHEE